MRWFSKKQHEQVRQPHIVDHNDAYVFRRSRTITGSLSSAVRSANEKHGDLRSPRLKTHELRLNRRKIGSLLLICLSVIGLLAGLLSQFIASTKFNDPTVPASEQSTYQKAVNDYLFARPGERFYFSLRTSSLTASLQQNYPEIQQASIESTGFLKSSQLNLVFRRPIASWNIRGKNYFIDASGVAFERNYYAQPALVVEDKTGINPQDLGAVASERQIRYIGRLVALVQGAGHRISKIELPPQTARQIDLVLEGRGYTIKTSLDRDPASQATDVINAVKYFDAKSITPQYIDVRIVSKAYYR